MIHLPQSRIFLYRQAADMRKSFDGLASLVGQHFPEVELSGSLFVFMNRRQTQLKALYWDEDGYALWCKRLQKGCFRALPGDSDKISRRELMLLLEGVVPKRMNKRFSLPERS
jgi:transposase